MEVGISGDKFNYGADRHRESWPSQVPKRRLSFSHLGRAERGSTWQSRLSWP